MKKTLRLIESIRRFRRNDMTVIKKLASAVLAAAVLITVPAVSGCSSGPAGGNPSTSQNSLLNDVKAHSFNSDYPDVPLEDVINKFVDDPEWNIVTENGVDYVTVQGTTRNVGKELRVEISVKDDPENEDMYLLDAEYVKFGNQNSVSVDDAWGYLLDIIEQYGIGAENLTAFDYELMEWVGTCYPLIEGFSWVDPPALELNENGVYSITGVILNESSDCNNATIKFVCYDSEGNQVETTFDMITSIKAGNKWKFKAVVFDSDKLASWDFDSFTAY